MDYKKEYDDICQKLMSAYNTTSFIEVRKAIEGIHPELRESEDERIRNCLRCLTSLDQAQDVIEDMGFTRQDLLAYLEKQKINTDGDFARGYDCGYECCLNSHGAEWFEKQKENPKSADSIPSKCASDAKCEDRWHKVADSLPDNGRLVLAQDCLGNTLLARYDGEGNWEVSVYDNNDYYCRNTITKWCEIPSEKQREQKHPDGCFTCDEYKKGYEEGRRNGFTAGYNKAIKEVEQEEQKPAEWSEITHISPLNIWQRIKKLNWPIEKALTKPVRDDGKHHARKEE